MRNAKSSLYKLILKRRSIRRFKQAPLPLRILKRLVEAARFAPSGANLQPLEFIAICDKKIRNDVFGTLAWAGYIAPKGTPREKERPTAYILVLINTRIRKENYQWDTGAAMENMILSALEQGIGSCWIGSINKPKLAGILGIPSHFIIDAILALGYPNEKPRVEKLKNDCKYWKDAQGVLHVPKRELKAIMHCNKF